MAKTYKITRTKRLLFNTFWGKFAAWITSTENRLYIGWFGCLMIPCLPNMTSFRRGDWEPNDLEELAELIRRLIEWLEEIWRKRNS